MGLYSSYTDAELAAIRTRLMTSLHERLTAPTAASGANRSVQYQQSPDQIRRELVAVNEEIDKRAGSRGPRSPIYLV